ncbi:unnamed protein product [Sphagnum jensenii]|uniref:STAS domain-containing protein n=1 Tax=Sphagnum jensenii TaxID=128206 RepID=A0ABP1A8L3_9BRYO
MDAAAENVRTDAPFVERGSRSAGRSSPVKLLSVNHPTTSSRSSASRFMDSSSSSSAAAAATWTAEDWRHLLERLVPAVRWLRTYDVRNYLKVDLIAGITVGTMLVPQAMSYARLAGLHPIYGLYSGFIPIFVYALFGSSRQLAIGPVALVSLLISNGLTPMVDLTKEGADIEYTQLAILLALMVGVLECLMGILRLGWLIRFISHSVISGFTSASAIIIAFSQAKSFLGYSVTRSSKIIPLVESIYAGRSQFKWQPFVMGSVVLAVLLIMKHVGKTYKHLKYFRAAGPITAVFFSTIFVKLLRPSSISVVGNIPQGLPGLSLDYRFEAASRLLPTAALITGVAILESVGIAKALAAKNGYELDSNQELFGLGVANIFGSAFSAYPSTGSFSRSAVMNETGAKTGLAGLVMGLVLCSALQFLTPLFSDIPQCALAAIVISAVVGLVDYDEAIFLWSVDKKDFLLWLAASIFTLFLGIEIGVLIGVGLSLAFVIYESANPHMAVLGRLPGTTVYRNVIQYPDAYIYHGMIILRIDSPIYFANINFIKDRLREFELQAGVSSKRGHDTGRLHFLIIEMSPVTYIDSTGIHAIKEIYQEYKARNIQIALCNPNHKVMVTLARAGIPQLIGESWYFVRVHDAVQVCTSLLQSDMYDEGSNIAENRRRGRSFEPWIKYERDQHSPNVMNVQSPWRREPVQSDSERISLLNASESV